MNIYLISTISEVNEIFIRYLICTKVGNTIRKVSSNIKTKKQSLVFLRSTKHFNIGKHKIHSFKTKCTMVLYPSKFFLPSIGYSGNIVYKVLTSCCINSPSFSIAAIKYTKQVFIQWN